MMRLGWIRKWILCAVLMLLSLSACKKQINVEAHSVTPKAELIFEEAVRITEEYFDVDSTYKAIALIDKAIEIDSLNPDYYGLKARLYAEMGNLETALQIQERADSLGAVNGEYLLQLGLFQAARDNDDKAKESFRRSSEYLTEVLKQYPDSLGAFINQRAANALYHENDSLFMPDFKEIRNKFPDRQMEIEMTRRLKPLSLIGQLKAIEADAINDMIREIDQEYFLNKED